MSPLQEYIAIIHLRQQDPVSSGERHHIIPRSCGGSNKKWNLVKLTSEEHIECHRLLTKIYPTGKEHRRMVYALRIMLNTRNGVSLSVEEAAEARRMFHADLTGVPRSKETRDKISKAHLGKHLTKEHKLKLSIAHKGKTPWNKGKKIGPHTEERNRKASESLKGKNKGKSPWNKGKHLTEEDKQKKREAALRNIARRKGNNS